MAIGSGFHLHSINVVVTAENHNPSVLTGEFMVDSGIVPRDWVLDHAITLPPFALLHFQNGMQWTLDQSHLIVTQPCSGSFQDSYDAHDCLQKYLERMESVPYRSLGLNCVVSLEVGNPRQDLTDRFLKDGPWLNDSYRLLGMIPTFAFEADEAVLNISCGVPAANDEQTTGIQFQCNVHHEGPKNAHELIQAIDQWRHHQTRIVDTLSVLFGGA